VIVFATDSTYSGPLPVGYASELQVWCCFLVPNELSSSALNTKTSTSALADILFPEAKEQQEFAEGILSVPPEQRRLHTETYDFTVTTVVDKLNNRSIFIPDFQRRYVWSDAQASRLIESLIIQCPIPVIYLNQEQDETLAVIDGNQRLTSISRFLKNSFPLKGLTAYPELEGNRFHELDPRIQRHVENRTLRCIVILKGTHPQVKFDVFERLNTGATKLNPQELRHGLYFGDVISLAAYVVKKTKLLSVLEIKADKRMKAEELVLRFWALDEDISKYRKPLAGFINDFAERKRTLSDAEKAELEKSFDDAFERVHALLGDLTFRIFDSSHHVESTFNAALYDALMVGVSTLLKSRKLETLTRSQAQMRLANLFEEDELFRKSISIATSDDSQVRYRIETVKKLYAKS